MRALLTIFTIIYLSSCGEKDFVVNKNVEGSQFNQGGSDVNRSCATGFEENRPKVDFLFVWDNSPSTKFINNETKQSLNSIIGTISESFDYHIMIAPLNHNNAPNNYRFLMTYDNNGLNSSARNLLHPLDNASSLLDSLPRLANGAGYEEGINRSLYLVQNNISNGIFRKNANTIIVLMSTGDIAYGITPGNYISPTAQENYIQSKIAQLQTLKSTTLNAQQLRFMSLVAHDNCKTGYRQGYGYMQTSSRLNPGKSDSFDMCGINFRNLFDGINNSIQSEVITHRYDHWPITSTSIPNFDPSTLVVKDTNGNTIPQSASNGWQYLGFTNVNLRYFPTAGDPYTGHALRLSGNARLNFGQCLQVITREPIDFYGYIVLQNKPSPDSIYINLNGASIAKANLSQPVSSRNGWEYIGQFSNKNIKVQSRTQPNTEATPGDFKSGYFIKLYGNAIIDNTQVTKVEVGFLPAAN